MKLLWFGDMAATGFGSVTTDIGREFINQGVDIRFVSQNELGDIPPEPFGSRTLDLAFYVANWDVTKGKVGVTGVQDMVGSLVTGESDAQMATGEPWGDWKPDVCVLLGDFTAARIMVSRFTSAFQKVPTFHYVPIEGTDLPPAWADLWRFIRPIAMSEFGVEQIEKVTGYRPPLAYHGVNADEFHAVTPTAPIEVPRDPDGGATVKLASREACKRFFGGNPDEVWMLRTDRNMPRKRYGALLRAVVPVLSKHDNARLVIHANTFDQGGYLPDSISKMPRHVQAQVKMTQMGAIPRPVLNALYAASDLYVTTSAEGFGLCVAEALMCGVPVVGMDYSAVPEVVGPAGKLVPIAYEYDNEYDHKWATPDEDAMSEAMMYMVEHAKKRRDLGALGPGHVSKSFRWDEAARVIADACMNYPD